MNQYVISIDGKFVDAAHATVSVLDHGFLFGDSVYEVVRTVNGRLFAADRHLKRLHGSAERIGLTLPHDDTWFIRHLREMQERRGGESYLRLIVTRGEGELDLHPGSCRQPKVVGIAKPLNQWPQSCYTEGAKIVLAQVLRNPREATDPAIKSGNYLNNVLAIIEARRENAVEAVMLNVSGNVTEATTSNIFLVRDGVLVTPDLGEGLLEGVTRGFVLGVAAKLGLEVEARAVPGDELMRADEVFLTSSTRDVMPVAWIGAHRVPLSPGPVTRRVAEAFREVLHDPANHQ